MNVVAQPTRTLAVRLAAVGAAVGAAVAMMLAGNASATTHNGALMCMTGGQSGVALGGHAICKKKSPL